jgi:hypothetical protein
VHRKRGQEVGRQCVGKDSISHEDLATCKVIKQSIRIREWNGSLSGRENELESVIIVGEGPEKADERFSENRIYHVHELL